MANTSITIIGAGPVGLFTALLLGQSGYEVAVFEKEEHVIDSPRACAYLPFTLQEFSRAGILKDVEDNSFKGTKGIAWRSTQESGGILGKLSPPITPEQPYFSLFMGQHELGAILLSHLAKMSNVTCFWNHDFTGLEQKNGEVTASFEVGQEKRALQHKSNFLIACDGGRSAVRQSLGIPLEGFSWTDTRFVATNIYYDLDKYDWPDVNFIVDPEHWAIVLRLSKAKNHWRVAFGAKAESGQILDSEKAMTLAREKYKILLPGNTDEIVLERANWYNTHQLCAAKFVEGNVILAGDAAHLNCPVGGLGLTTGLLDAATLGEIFKTIRVGGQSTIEMLKAYEDSRREAFLSYTNPISIQNFKRLFSLESADVMEREERFKMINEPNIPYILRMMHRESKMSTTAQYTAKYDTKDEIVWFISVTKIDDWEHDRFEHEYHGVHAQMTAGVAKFVPAFHQYYQNKNLEFWHREEDQPRWNCISCLTWESLQVVWDGFQLPQYRATAGSHIFCRLDQVGTLTRRFDGFETSGPRDREREMEARILVFHRRVSPSIRASRSWMEERVSNARTDFAESKSLTSYRLLEDVTPEDTDFFFKDTLFQPPGFWHRYQAVEELCFVDREEARKFVEDHAKFLEGTAAGSPPQVVLADALKVV
ncbi:hypothetical protein BKA64DRAFT_774076 [Cadophora sp. MPI-SDFR-AT-0126]|nr:hypothetical protein BKA64DRAFT_774076 [Leotiomycetes sp. MPI-SDFR-AT-0126]